MKAVIFALIFLAVGACKNGPDRFGQNNPMPQIGNDSVYSDMFNQFSGASGSSAAVQSFINQYQAIERERYTYAIFTDQSGGAKAQEVKRTIENQPPFNLFELNFIIEIVTKEQLGCHRDPDIDRLLLANTSFVSRRTAELGADQAMVVCESGYGGSGGNIPVVSTSGDSGKIMLHELLHTLGFADEYEYKESEAHRYCDARRNQINLAFIEPQNPYASDQSARQAHQNAILWYGQIIPTTPITQSQQLGSRKARNVIGLYESITCNEINVKTWKPGSEESVMEDHENGVDAIYQTLVFEILTDKGIPLKNIPGEESVAPTVNDAQRVNHESSGTKNSTVVPPPEATPR